MARWVATRQGVCHIGDMNAYENIRINQAKKLLADLQSIDWAATSERDMVELLGRTRAVVADLIEVAAKNLD